MGRWWLSCACIQPVSWSRQHDQYTFVLHISLTWRSVIVMINPQDLSSVWVFIWCRWGWRRSYYNCLYSLLPQGQPAYCGDLCRKLRAVSEIFKLKYQIIWQELGRMFSWNTYSDWIINSQFLQWEICKVQFFLIKTKWAKSEIIHTLMSYNMQ